ncbi:MAG: hypothetical protein ACE5H0_03470 [Bacteroidota bacterium]
MGIASILDILSSLVLFGLLFLIALGINDAATETMYLYGGELLVQENLVEVAKLVEYDLRKIGYSADPTLLPDPSKAILNADDHGIKFLTDVVTVSNPRGDGTLDTMHYYLGPVDELAQTPNPRDRYLYRVINNQNPVGVNLGVVLFDIAYFNAQGETINTPVAVPGEISTMEVTVAVENPAAYADEYSTAMWKQLRLASRNLRNR